MCAVIISLKILTITIYYYFYFSVLNMEHCITKGKAEHPLLYLTQQRMPWIRWALLTAFLRSVGPSPWTQTDVMGTIYSSQIHPLFIPLPLPRSTRVLVVPTNLSEMGKGICFVKQCSKTKMKFCIVFEYYELGLIQFFVSVHLLTQTSAHCVLYLRANTSKHPVLIHHVSILTHHIVPLIHHPHCTWTIP